MTDSARLVAGDRAPSFCLPNQYSSQVCLESLSGKVSIVYFYPKDMTPGCTLEATDLNEMGDRLRDLNIGLVGISPDSVESHLNFAERFHLGFDLLSDPTKAVMSAWGAYGEKMNYGRKVVGVIRSTFILNPDLTIAHALYAVKATGHATRILRLCEAMAPSR
ncbi:peroxiredoxin [Ferrimicrobium sp.]|uniref:peroxiredoxin n=1 Tax=Ferrimicrobium sp. TaxID=2926050 RepID=UPI002609EAA1|nr:peroxiredoxin [Ferrimicrobium sp.]